MTDCEHNIRKVDGNMLYCAQCGNVLMTGLKEQSPASKAFVILLVCISLIISLTLIIG